MHGTKYAVVAHGGAGNDTRNTDGCIAAVEQAVRALDRGGDALAAALAATVHLENDVRFNAGSGAVSAEMDAAVMDTRGQLGAVACLRDVKNPVLVARDVARSAHVCLAGEGALQFARKHGHAYFSHSKEALASCDTVGAVVRDADGHFAIAASTGGTSPALPGRVGDTPMMGSGFYAGPHGAVAATGTGEHIVRELLAFRVYQWIEQGMPLQQALERGVGLFSKEVSVGLIAVSKTEMGAFANRPMPSAEACHG